jgi:hypothetical protein
MWQYLQNVTTAGPPSSGLLFSHQALWQESDNSIFIGLKYNSSLILDEVWSNLNFLLLQRLKSGDLKPPFNFFEINNICDGGPEIAAALKAANKEWLLR